uniref:MATH domain-containing protein n=1 Tax=Lactuca sativa TaxID=4236 RepID=A0A9R1UIR5_LACSA|nr:hypothetical protein LSAT_V11C900501510 [Lactuca sativa]
MGGGDNFFVYDHIHHNYKTFQDIHRKRARFDDNQNKWGFAKLIPLVHFKDISKGYLSTNDSCVFGVEVSTDPMYTIKDRCLSMIKPQETTNSYTWIIDNLSAVTEKCLHSEVFKVGKVKWTLSIYPKGISSGKGTNLSIFLEVHEAALASAGWRVYAKYQLRVKNQRGYDDRVEVKNI